LLAAYGLAIGPAFHGLAAPVGLIAQAAQGSPTDVHLALTQLLQRTALYTQPLAVLVVPCLLTASVWYAVDVGFKRTHLPRWMALCNLLVFLLVFALVSVIASPLALVLVPTALNLADLAFFVLCTIVL
jgi:hypothetical protein